MITHTINKHQLSRISLDILGCMETGTLPCFYESLSAVIQKPEILYQNGYRISMNDFIVQEIDCFLIGLC